MAAAGVSTAYAMDTSAPLSAGGQRPLVAEADGGSTYYLYGLGSIGEQSGAWSYALPDGTGTPRQQVDAAGAVTFTVRYTPWGDVLESYGGGGASFGYFGGLVDAATGLLYAGNGQYYDPVTGRFLSRGTKPNTTNPYMPWDPIGGLLAPLGLLALVFGRRKRKPGKWGAWLVMLIVLSSISISLVSCGQGNNQPTVEVTDESGTTKKYTATMEDDGVTIKTLTPVPEGTATPPPSYTCTATATSTPIPTPTETTIEGIKAELSKYGVSVTGNWPSANSLGYILAAVKKVAGRFANELMVSPEQAFKEIYGNYTFQRGCNCTGLAITSPLDMIMVDHFFGEGGNTEWADYPEINVRLIIHELGHAFEYRACEEKYGQSTCTISPAEMPIRSKLKTDWIEKEYLQRNTYGDESSGYSGFAGGQWRWQFAMRTEKHEAGEVWADMFLGWVYENLSPGRMEYMNDVMPGYLRLIAGG